MDKYMIVLDSNSFGVYKDNEIFKKIRDYETFEKINYNKKIDVMLRFINRNKLRKNVNVFVPEIVLLEIINQQNKSYSNLIKILEKINIPNVTIDVLKIDYREFLKNDIDNIKAIVKILKVPKRNIVSDLISRAINEQSPFNGSKSASDKGFKDVILWESMLNYNKINEYSKVYLLTKDSIFDNKCTEEFMNKKEVEIEIINGANNLDKILEILRTKYSIDSELDDAREYIDQELTGFILSDLQNKRIIEIDEGTYEIDSYEVNKISVGSLEKIIEDGFSYYINQTEITVSPKGTEKVKVFVETKMTSGQPPENINYSYMLK